MPSSTITQKGQITLPKKVRTSLGVRTGDRIAFRITSDGRVFVEPENVDLLSLVGCLKSRKSGVSIDDMRDVVRRRAEEEALGQ